jgi:hypothetical protein
MNDTWYSTDGTTWTKAKPDDMNGFSARDSHSSVVIDGKMWVIGGQTCPNGCSYLNDVWFSEDGITWINAKPDDVSGFFARKDFGAATFGDKMWVLTGYYYDDLIYEYYFGDVWYSDRR